MMKLKRVVNCAVCNGIVTLDTNTWTIKCACGETKTDHEALKDMKIWQEI